MKIQHLLILILFCNNIYSFGQYQGVDTKAPQTSLTNDSIDTNLSEQERKLQQEIEEIIKERTAMPSSDSVTRNFRQMDSTRNLNDLLPKSTTSYAGGYLPTTYESTYYTDSRGRRYKQYENYNYNISHEANLENFAQNQTTGEKWKNGLIKFFGNTGISIIIGNLGLINGVLEAINMGDLNYMFDNSFNNSLLDLKQRINFTLPNYWTQEDKNSLNKQMYTANFWADDFLRGLSFTAGEAVITYFNQNQKKD